MASYPAAIWRPGPKSKQGYIGLRDNTCRGVICHSMVGSFAGAMARLDDVNDSASWQFSVTQDGHVWQHYDSAAVCWHAGSPGWNGVLIGIEHEGGAAGNESEPLTDVQRKASVALVSWLADTHHFSLVRFNGGTGNLYEHREVFQTACPSGRIPWEEYTRMYTDTQIDQKIAAVLQATAGNGKKVDDLANAVDALPATKGQLRFIWSVAGKLWPFGP